MKSRVLLAAFVFTSVLLPTKAEAACTYCWYPGYCWDLWERSCNEVRKAGLSGTCFTMGAEMFRPGSDFLLNESGRAWLVQGTKRTPIASDAMSAAITRVLAKYTDAKALNPKAKAERDAAWEVIFKTPDTGPTSPEVLSRLAKEMGLSVRTSGARLR